LMRQPEYREGRYDTTYLDRLLVDRRANGASFSELSGEDEELAAIAAGIDAFLRASAGASGSPDRWQSTQWKQTARREALR